jgi:Uma2 family endonuclease
MIQPNAASSDLVRYDTFRAIVADGCKADLIDGVIHMASPDTRDHAALTLFLAYLIEGYNAARKLRGFTFFSRFACRISDYRAPEPDVGYVRKERVQLVEDNELNGPPDVAVEVVSRDSRHRDYVEKRALYLDAGVTEYWIVDPILRCAEFLRLNRGEYEALPLEANRIFRSTVIPGFWLNVDWLHARPVPAAYGCLEEILRSARRRPRRKKGS